MEDVLLRCVIKFSFRKKFIGKDYNNRWYIIQKNSLSKNFKVGCDYNFYANIERGRFFRIATPVNIEV